MREPCTKCRARCCRYLCVPLGEPETFEDFDELRWYLTHEHISIHVDLDGGWFLRIDNRCSWLAETPQGPQCVHYEDRSLICRSFSPDSCDFTHGDYDYAELFRRPEELEAYARRRLGEAAFLKARDKARKQRPS